LQYELAKQGIDTSPEEAHNLFMQSSYMTPIAIYSKN